VVYEQKKASAKHVFFEALPKAFRKLLQICQSKGVHVHPLPLANLAQRIGKSVWGHGVQAGYGEGESGDAGNWC
jgi:hypothetical protein